MTRFLSIALSLLAVSVFGQSATINTLHVGTLVIGEPPPPPGPACEGDFMSGATERFEAGEGQFCTSGWTVVDPDSILNAYDTNQFVTGAASMSITQGETYTNSYIYQSIGEDKTFSFRFYIRATGMSPNGGNVWRLVEIDNDTGFSGTATLAVELRQSGGTTIRMAGATTSPSRPLSHDTWHRVEVGFGGAGETASMRVFTLGGTEVGEVSTCTAASTAPNFIGFGSVPGSSVFNVTNTICFDNIVLDLDSAHPIGQDE